MTREGGNRSCSLKEDVATKREKRRIALFLPSFQLLLSLQWPHMKPSWKPDDKGALGSPALRSGNSGGGQRMHLSINKPDSGPVTLSSLASALENDFFPPPSSRAQNISHQPFLFLLLNVRKKGTSLVFSKEQQVNVIKMATKHRIGRLDSPSSRCLKNLRDLSSGIRWNGALEILLCDVEKLLQTL